MSSDPSRLDFARLKQAVSIERVLADQGLLRHMSLRGARITGPCPIHKGDNRRAFVVDRRKGLWRCFSGCDRGGDVVELVRALNQCSYRQAALYLAQVEGGLPPAPTSGPLPAAPSARPFLPFTRTLPLDHHHSALSARGLRPRTAARFEVGAWHGRGMLTGCVAFRLRAPDGRPWGYMGRRMHPQDVARRGKWVLPTGLPKGELLYGFVQAGPQLHRGLVVVEGAWDVLRLHQLGVPAVALLGVRLSQTQRRLLHRAPKLVLMLDSDAAGRRAAAHIQRQLQQSIPTRTVQLPPGRDPDQLSDKQLASLLSPPLLF